MSSQAIFNESGEIKKSEKLGKSGQVGTCKLILFSTLQTFKNKIIPVWWLNKRIVSTHFVHFVRQIRALTEII